MSAKRYVLYCMILFSCMTSNVFAVESDLVGEEKIVTARGEAGCSEDMSISDCKSAALALAKRHAAEQTETIIQSETHVKDFVVESDKINSSIYAVVKSFKVLRNGAIGDGIGYFYEIEAVVQAKYRDPSQMHSFAKCTGQGADYLSKANASFNEKQKISYLKMAMQYCPDSADPHIVLGELLMQSKDVNDQSKALMHFKTALRIEPDNKTSAEYVRLLSNTQSSHKSMTFDSLLE